MFAKVRIGILTSLCTVALSGCGAQLYNVSPLPASTPPALPADQADGITLVAMALDGDQSLERFEANLPLAGVIAVDVRLVNHSPTAVDLGAFKFELRTAAGKSFKPIAPKQALKRVMKFYGDSVYRLDARQATIELYNAISFPVSGSVAPQEERRGSLFFEAERNAAIPAGLTLVAPGVKPPISVKVN